MSEMENRDVNGRKHESNACDAGQTHNFIFFRDPHPLHHVCIPYTYYSSTRVHACMYIHLCHASVVHTTRTIGISFVSLKSRLVPLLYRGTVCIINECIVMFPLLHLYSYHKNSIYLLIFIYIYY